MSLSARKKTSTEKPILLEEEMKIFFLKISQDESVRIMKSGSGRLYIPILDLALYLGYENIQREHYIRRGMSKIYILTLDGQKTKIVDIEDCIKFMGNLRGIRLDKAKRFSQALEQECSKSADNCSADNCSMDRNAVVQEVTKLYSILDNLFMTQSQLMMFIETSPLTSLISNERNRTIAEGISRVKESYSSFLESMGQGASSLVSGNNDIANTSPEICH